MPRTLPKKIEQTLEKLPNALLEARHHIEESPEHGQHVTQALLDDRRDILVLTEQIVSMLYVRMWDALQGAVIMGFAIASLIWTFRGLSQLSEWLQSSPLQRFLPGSRELVMQSQSFFGASTLGVASLHLFIIALCVLLIALFARHLAVLLFALRDLSSLRAIEKRRREECAALEKLLRSLKKADK